MPALHPKNQISQDWLSINSNDLFKKFAPWLKKHEEGEISYSELTIIYILIFVKTWREKLWTSGTNPEKIEFEPSQIILKNIFPDIETKFASLDIMTFMARYLLRGVSLRVHRALILWSQKKIKMNLLFYIPKPLEILDFQARGERIVTIFNTAKTFAEYHYGKDPLTFVLHDLEHADEFFHENQNHIEQVQFYKKIKTDIDKGKFTEFLKNKKFKSDFEYLISDMNSHPSHLEATLQALLKIHQPAS